ncbi:MAG: GxxExxY protein [Thermoanaerobaculales bacterium]|nr:GxxExxY protein [Thermoanaerobaculales bacterium]
MNHQDTKTPRVSPREPSKAVDRIATEIVDAAYKVHSELGPGLLESTYEVCLEHELKKRGLTVRRQVSLPVVYDSIEIEAGYRLDLVVEESVIVELKSVDALLQIHVAQVLTYLKLGRYKLGFLMNFNVTRIKDGVKRIVL